MSTATHFWLDSDLIAVVGDKCGKCGKWGPFEHFNHLPLKSTIFVMFGNKTLHEDGLNRHFAANPS
jgi:hypothetical protein